MRFVLNLLFPNMELVHIFRIPRPKGIVGVILHMLRVPHLLKKGGRDARDSGSDSPNAQGPHLLEKGRGMPHPGRQTIEVPGSDRVSVEEFFNGISKSKIKIFLRTPSKVKEPTSYEEAIDSPNHKEWMDAMRDEMDSMARNKV